MTPLRHLVVVLGDQLDRQGVVFDGFDASVDRVWMAEADEESTHVWSTLPRTTMFLAAMRHFAQALRSEGLSLHYRALDDAPPASTLVQALHEALQQQRPQAVVLEEPGDWRVQQALRAACAEAGVPLQWRESRHFLCTAAEFDRHARGRSELRMEYFYREQRQRLGVLMDGNQPCGGRWNFDTENRHSFGAQGPGFLPEPPRFEPDAIAREVIALVRRRFPGHRGSLDHFAWPVTRAQALHALERFIEDRLPDFGAFQDALSMGEPWLYHSQLSAALNLKLLNPREVLQRAEDAWRAGRAPLASVEGFIRQIVGWREYVRGIYRREMPGYAECNALDATEPLPAFYWSGDCEMRCLRDTVTQTLRHGYAHHIQRLMVTGLYAQLLGVQPQQVHAWYLAVYVDAVEWVEMPNTLGMSQYADGGLMGSKPYVASGRYLQRMSDYCRGCRFDPARAAGDDACPYTTLYWDFLLRHRQRFASHPRMVMQLRNLARLNESDRIGVARRAAEIRANGGVPPAHESPRRTSAAIQPIHSSGSR